MHFDLTERGAKTSMTNTSEVQIFLSIQRKSLVKPSHTAKPHEDARPQISSAEPGEASYDGQSEVSYISKKSERGCEMEDPIIHVVSHLEQGVSMESGSLQVWKGVPSLAPLFFRQVCWKIPVLDKNE